MARNNDEMNDAQARAILGIDANNWIIQFTDEELRMLQEVMNAEKRRRADLFDGLFQKIDEIG